MKLIYTRIILLFCLVAFVVKAGADDLRSMESSPGLIHVGVIMDMPFAQNIDGQYSGIAIDIWEKIARLNHWKFIYVPLSSNSMESTIDTLATSPNLDVVVGPVSVSSSRLEKVDFSRPFYLSSVGVVTKRHEIAVSDIIRMLLSKNLLHVIIILVLTFSLYLTLLWLFERKKAGQGAAPQNLYPSLTQRIWLHLFQKKVDYMPVTTQGRIIGIFWIIIAAAIFTAINANFTSALTIARYENDHITSSIAGLQSARVAGIKGQFNVEIAEKNGIPVTRVSSMEEAVKLLEKDKVDGIVCDTPLASNYLRHHDLQNLVLSPVILEHEELSFALKLDSPLRHVIDLGITSFQDDDSVVPLCRRYIGDEAKYCDI